VKSLLKLLGAIALATMPVITVVACDDDKPTITDSDISKIAAAQVADTELNMSEIKIKTTQDLFALKDHKFTEFESTIKDNIAAYFQKKVTTSSDASPETKTTWYYPSASCIITDGPDDPSNNNKFQDNFDGKVNGKITLQATITYKSESSITKPIILTIDNDQSDAQAKANAIRDFVITEIGKSSGEISLEALPTAGEFTKNDAQKQFSIFSKDLATAITKWVGYQSLSVNFEFDGNETTPKPLFKFNNWRIEDKKIIFIGDLQNVKIDFIVAGGGFATSKPDKTTSPPTIKVIQTEANARNQIERIINDLRFNVNKLPDSSESFSSYDQKMSGDFTKSIQEKLFDNINAIYKVDATITPTPSNWSQDIITIPDTSKSSKYIADVPDSTGHFILNFKFEYQFDSSLPAAFTLTKNNINVNLKLKSNDITGITIAVPRITANLTQDYKELNTKSDITNPVITAIESKTGIAITAADFDLTNTGSGNQVVDATITFTVKGKPTVPEKLSGTFTFDLTLKTNDITGITITAPNTIAADKIQDYKELNDNEDIITAIIDGITSKTGIITITAADFKLSNNGSGNQVADTTITFTVEGTNIKPNQISGTFTFDLTLI